MNFDSLDITKIALDLLGPPNNKLSNEKCTRYGKKGSIAIDKEKNQFYDHENCRGGGPLQLVELAKGLSPDEARKFLSPTPIESPTEYIYTDTQGTPALKVIRTVQKKFYQMRYDDGKWVKGAKGVKAYPYRLPEVLTAINKKLPIYIVEGEKDVETLNSFGLTATCNAGGAGKWNDHHSKYLTGAKVVVIEDNDAAGRNHGRIVISSLLKVCDAVSHLQLKDTPEKFDISDKIHRDQLNSQDLIDYIESNARRITKQGIIATRLDRIQATTIDWLWPNYLAKGKLHILAGPAGVGKTTIALGIAATISSGGLFPDGSAPQQSGNIVIWSGEDSASDTLKPRLIAAGADPAKIHIITGYQDADIEQPFDPSVHCSELAAFCRTLDEGAALVLIDPIISAVKGDSHKANDVRRDLQPLVSLAEQENCCVLGITHFSKGNKGASPQDRVIGSQAFSALARTVFVCATSKDNGTRIFTKAKSNISEDGGGFSYELEIIELEGLGITTSTATWQDPFFGSANEALALVEGGDDPLPLTGQDLAAEALEEYLSSKGGALSSDVQAHLTEQGFSNKMIRLARTKLGVTTTKIAHGKSIWKLPQLKCPQMPSEALEKSRASEGTCETSSVEEFEL